MSPKPCLCPKILYSMKQKQVLSKKIKDTVYSVLLHQLRIQFYEVDTFFQMRCCSRNLYLMSAPSWKIDVKKSRKYEFC